MIDIQKHNIHQCEKCGAKYEIFEQRLIMRDNDSLDCQKCGHELISWNGAVCYTAKLIS